MTLNVLSIGPELFFLVEPKASHFKTEIADKHDVVGKVVDSFKQPKVWISIWAVNGSQK